jgi:dihydropteroate synthase
VQNKTFITKKTLNLQGRILDLAVPRVMGILNVTPDSFYSSSRLTTELDLLTRAEKMLAEGASILDVGGYSSRPGASEIPEAEEHERISIALKALIKEFPKALISVDTFRSSVAMHAVQEGAAMINDISGGMLAPRMIETVTRLKIPYILMHMRGTPQTMTSETTYGNLVKDVIDYFHAKIAILQEGGMKDILLDPGFGFAKTIDQNFELLHKLEHFRLFEKPLVVGISRKSMIWKSLDSSADQALNGTTVLNTLALSKGASILRVHDVKEAFEAITLYQKTMKHGD